MKRFLPLLALLFCTVYYSVAQTPTTIAYGNDWVATDALGRTLPDYTTTGGVRGQRYVGMFYWLWHPYIRVKDGPQKTTTQLIHENPNSPAFECNDTYWGEPENGFYHPEDPWSTRRNLQLLANAGVDFIYIDFTNGSQGCDALNSFMSVALDMYNKGIPVPKIVFFLNEGANDAINCIMDKIYNNNAYQPLWFYWQGKPLIMADQAKCCAQSARACSDQVKNFFTWRKTWAFDANQWNFLDDYPQDYYSYNGVPEQMPVTKAMGAPIFNNDQGSSKLAGGPIPTYDQYWETPTSGQGLRFEQNWSRAHQIDPQIVCVSGWNELVAAAWPSRADNSNVSCMGKQWNDPSWRCVNHASCISKDANGNHLDHGWYYVDEFNTEFNRDLEPMKGGYTDNYYYQLVAHVRKHKGLAAPQPVSLAKTIGMDGQFGEWSSVMPVYKDAEGDCQHRNFKDVKNYQTLTNNSGRNDIIETRSTTDGATIYFYIKTASAITSYTDQNWMMVYLNTDRDKSTGWEGFDYVLNMGVNSASQTTIKKRTGSTWTTIGTAAYNVSGNEMEISVSRASLELTSNTVAYYYQVFDNPSALDNIEDNFIHGESAPDRRFNYPVSIPCPFGGSANYWDFVSTIEGWNTMQGINASAANSVATLAITGGDPYMHSPDNLGIAASDYKYMVISMQNMTGDNTAELFWITNANTGYDAVKHVNIPIVPNDTRQRYYIIDLSSNPNWTGTIRQIRLDPVSAVTSGSVKVDFIKLVGTYAAAPKVIPGIIEIEDFDKGGQGNAYNDSDVINNGSEYRVNEGVDIQATTGGGYNTGWLLQGEWMDYLVKVATADSFRLHLKAASIFSDHKISLWLDGIKIQTLLIPNTGDWQTFADIRITTPVLPSGLHVLRIYAEDGDVNMDKLILNTVPVIVPNVNVNNAGWVSTTAASVCAGGTVMLGPQPSVSGNWSWKGPDGFTSGNREITLSAITAAQAGIYTATYTDANGETVSKSSTITVTSPSVWYADTDGDGKGDPAVTKQACTKPAGYVAAAGDACPTDATKSAAGACGCGHTESSCLDCAGVPNGTAVTDNCQICTGGTTGKTACVTTAVENGTQTAAISIAPQPFEQYTTLSLANGNTISSIQIINASGAIVETRINIQEQSVRIGEALSSGLYSVLVQSGSNVYTVRIVKL